MGPVGIIANPASGKDIRRLVAHGSVFPNSEKVNILKRVLLGLDSTGVEEVFLMPDYYGLGRRALESLNLSLKAFFLDMQAQDNQDDSTRAAAMLADMDASCLVVLGGDGTNRVVAKTSQDVPLLSIATGTNNVFSHMLEGTLAGIAAGIVALNASSPEDLTSQVPRLEVWRDDQLIDISLVDIVVSTSSFVGTRAIWDVSTIREIFLIRSDPGSIGFSSLGGYLNPVDFDAGRGLHIIVGPGNTRVKAPIAPGLVHWVPIKSHSEFDPLHDIPIHGAPVMLALDGERELRVAKNQTVSVRLNLEGPRVVSLEKAFRKASEQGIFLDGKF